MKKITALLLAALLAALCSCGAKENTKETTVPDGTETTSAAEPQAEQLKLRVVDGAGTGTLVLAGEKSGDVYTASVNEITVYIDGVLSEPSSLEDGMTVWVDGGYELLETWPAQFAGAVLRAYGRGTEKEPGGKGFDLCGLYLRVLEDLWKEDGGLNGGAEFVSVDLKKAPGGMTDGEISAVAWIFASAHGAQPLTFNMDELAENGYLSEEGDIVRSDDAPPLYYWESGLLFSITASEKNDPDSKKEIRFDAEKWRSPLGAIFFTDCSAEWNKNGTWESYKPGAFAIA